MTEVLTSFGQLTEGTCVCGRDHHPVTRIFMGSGACSDLPRTFASLHPDGGVLVVSDLNTHQIAGEEVGALLGSAGYRVEQLVIPSRHPHTNEETMDLVRQADPGRFGLLVSVGSGTVTDVVRLVGHHTGRPFVAVATAASMDGYASNVVPILKDGIKQAVPATPPLAVVVDLDLIATAPAPMTLAGLGDLVGKLTARGDWTMAHLLTGEYFCPRLAELSAAALTRAQADLSGMAAGVPEALDALCKGFFLPGWPCRWPAIPARHRAPNTTSDTTGKNAPSCPGRSQASTARVSGWPRRSWPL